MELKNLLTKLKHKEELPEHFFALEISDDVIKSSVWTVFDGNTKVVKIGAIKSWDGQDHTKLLELVDQSISEASDNISPEPSGVVFGLPESWIDSEGINPERKKLLKTLTQELELKPLGFVVTDTAIIQYLKIEEGTPPSAIFLQLNPSELNLTLVKLGKIIGQELIGRSEDLGSDVEEGLSRFDNIDTLPSRMILYNGKSDFEEDKQQLISYDWEEKLPFIHFPKVESLSQDASIKAISLAGGSEVAKSLGFEIKPAKDLKTPQSEFLESSTGEYPSLQDKSSSPDNQQEKLTAESLGFSSKDAVETLESEPEKHEPAKDLKTPQSESLESSPGDDHLSEEESVPRASLASKFSSLLQSIKPVFAKTLSKLKSLKSLKKTPKTLTIVGIAFATLTIGVFAAYWYIPKAKIVIFIEPKTIDEELTLIIDPDATTLDEKEGILPGESLEISVEGSKSISTTGTSLIGDPAEGDITIFNKTNDLKTFSAGTVLIGPDNLAFTLDKEVTVASSSTTIDDDDRTIITPGKTTTSIAAKSIGPEGNLSSSTRLEFKQFSEDDYYAKVINDLSGGTAREVKAVSEEDQENLLTALTEELKQQAQLELKNELNNDKSLVDIKDLDKLTSKNFNHALNEEADTLTLDAKLEYTALAYNQSDLELLLNKSINQKIPDNFTLSDASQIESDPAELQKNGTAIVEVIFKAKLVPKLDFNDLKQNLKGKYPDIIQDYLGSIQNFIRADITITPNLPKKLKTLPRVSKNILIEIKLED